MKPAILIVMLDFLVCSLLLFVIGSGGQQTQFATSATATATVHADYSPTAIAAMQEEWNRDYEQQLLLTQLNTESAANEQLRGRLGETSEALTAKEREAENLKNLTAQREQTIRTLNANLNTLSEEKSKIEQSKSRVDQAMLKLESQVGQLSGEREKLQKEGETAKAGLTKLQTEIASLQTQQSKLQQEKTALAQRTDQLNQTVASQQATIGTLTEEVRASQARVESQLNDVARDQQQMVSTLKQLDDFARTLPVTIQKNVGGIHDQQQSMQDNIAALADGVKDLQTELNGEERTRLMQALSDVAKGQQGLQSRLDTLIKAGPNEQITQSLNTIEAGQDALRQQTAKLADQIETIKARKPGPFQAVKGARIELLVSITKLDNRDATPMRFNSSAYPPVVRADGRVYIVANSQTLGFGWWALGSEYYPQGDITDLKYVVNRRGDAPVSTTLNTTACALRTDPRVVTIELDSATTGVHTMELAGPDKLFQSDERKFHVFKSTAAGLSFEIDTSPDLADARYLVVKRALRGVASWFENPAYRADVGDYVVTSDGKFIGIMVTREKCFILSRENIMACAATVPLADKQQFNRAVAQVRKIK